jgi:hypothetical protein
MPRQFEKSDSVLDQDKEQLDPQQWLYKNCFPPIFSHTGVNESINALHNKYLPKRTFFQ